MKMRSLSSFRARLDPEHLRPLGLGHGGDGFQSQQRAARWCQ
jgi:hypothetical protein